MSFADLHAILAAGYEFELPDPDDPAKVLAMPIVLHLPKADPPRHSDLLEAAARAVISLCFDPRVDIADDGTPGPWRAGYLAWSDARIRKVSRRARGAQWEAANEVDGVTVDLGSAQARAFVPGPVGELDHRIKRLQVGGTDLPMDDPGAPRPGEPVLWVNASLGMTVGKGAAQVGHAAMHLAGSMSVEQASAWAQTGFACSVREADPTTWERLLRLVDDGAAQPVRDAGYTEVAPGSVTVIATELPITDTP